MFLSPTKLTLNTPVKMSVCVVKISTSTLASGHPGPFAKPKFAKPQWTFLCENKKKRNHAVE